MAGFAKRPRMPSAFVGLATSLVVLGARAPALARFGGDGDFFEDVPVERLLRNTERYLARHPEDGQAHYILGRLHGMAFARPGEPVAAETDEPSGVVARILSGEGSDLEKALASVETSPPSPPPVAGSKPRTDSPAPAATPTPQPNAGLPKLAHGRIVHRVAHREKMDDLRRGHLRAAVLHLRRAIALSPEQAHFFLGLGWVLDQSADVEGTDTRGEALEAYRRAYQLAEKREAAQVLLMPGTFLVAPEAGAEFLRLLARKPTLSAEEKAERSAVEANLKKIASKPYLMTPIILSLRESGSSLAALLDPEATVDFDLAGDGVPRAWPWVKPTTAILVWDPRREGRVRSGRQLFGASTWWCLWRDGYEPLEALDDDGDGRLTGEELDGLAVWRDQDGDGVSDPGEVVSARAAGVVALTTSPAGLREGVVWNASGALLSDGTARATFDWTPVSQRALPPPERVPPARPSVASR